jgi:hypothetical protein
LSQEALAQVPDEPMEVEPRDDQEPLELKEDDLQQQLTPLVADTNLTSISRVIIDCEDGFRTLLKDIEGKKKDESLAIDQLMSYCYMFLNSNILNYINSGDHPNTGKCLI